MNLPNRLTLLRIALVPLYMVLVCANFPFHHTAALAVFGIASFTDLLDGKIARSRGLVTNLGKFLDPIADKLLTTAAYVLFLMCGCIDVWAIMLILAREFMVTSVRLMAAGDGTVVAASFAGKLKTVMQYVAIIAMTVVMQWCEMCAAWWPWMPAAAYDVPLVIGRVLIWVAVVFTVWSGFQYFWQFPPYFSDGR